MDPKAYQAVIIYHDRSKHSFQRYAKSLGYMDWKNQPNPFRFYAGTRQIPLPLLQTHFPAGHLDLYQRDDNPVQPFLLQQVAGFLELSLGLSAWKAVAENRWSLRINPSSGNLHPTECHLLMPAMHGVPGGVYHYNPLLHALELRAEVNPKLWESMVGYLGCEGFLVGLSSIFWRESWKYGERAFRYCNHDVGHALACLSFSANLQGWQISCLNALPDTAVATLLGFDKVSWETLEEECAEVLCFVHSKEVSDVPRGLPPQAIDAVGDLAFAGTPNRLSGQRVRWSVIYDTAWQTQKPATEPKRYQYEKSAFYATASSSLSAVQLIRQRRSAVAFSGDGVLTLDEFLTLLDKTRARDGCPPFDMELMEPSIHLLLFVHSVQGLEQGLYFFLRNESDRVVLADSCHPQFLWQPVAKGFPLYFLQRGNFRQMAARVSCDQDIAASGVFAVAMIANFSHVLEREPYRYRHLHWETGMIGQIFYLEAEAHGLRGTGIGCFFDDAVHHLLGFEDNKFQSLYHFTVGDPVDDPRLATLPPYAHLKHPRA